MFYSWKNSIHVCLWILLTTKQKEKENSKTFWAWTEWYCCPFETQFISLFIYSILGEDAHWIVEFCFGPNPISWQTYIQGDCLKASRFCFWISPILIEIQSSIHLMHLVKLTKFTLGPILRKVTIGFTQPNK